MQTAGNIHPKTILFTIDEGILEAIAANDTDIQPARYDLRDVMMGVPARTLPAVSRPGTADPVSAAN